MIYPAVVAHDAGGAEVLSAYMKKQGIKKAAYYLRGSAADIFKEKGLISSSYVFDPAWDDRTGYLFASMSWKDDIALRMTREAKRRGIPAELILDSWYDYSRRFGAPGRSWKDNLPDRLTVCDDVAEGIARRQRLDSYCSINKIANPYLEEILTAYVLNGHRKKARDNYLLFLSSPISEARAHRLNELSGTKLSGMDLIKDVLAVCNKKGITVKVRLHPSEKSACIDPYAGLGAGIESADIKNSLLDDLSGAKYVVGFCSMALVVAALLGKTAVSFAKGDLADVFRWEEYGVYKYYGIKNCKSRDSLSRILV